MILHPSETLLPPVPGSFKITETKQCFFSPVNIWACLDLLARWTTKQSPVWLWWRSPLYWMWLPSAARQSGKHLRGAVIWTECRFPNREQSFDRDQNVFLFKIRVCTSVRAGVMGCNLIGMWAWKMRLFKFLCDTSEEGESDIFPAVL